jgi:hypothetical protein
MPEMILRAETVRPHRLLDLDYAPHVPMATLHRLEAAARRMGLPLHQLELLGQDANVAEGFVMACMLGDSENFCLAVDWQELEERREAHDSACNGGVVC